MPKVEIFITPGSMGSLVKIDGQEIPQVRSVTVSCGVGEASLVKLELIATEVVVAGEVDSVET